LGLAVLLGSLTPLLVAPVFGALMDRIFIVPEEKDMEETFGDDYREYKKKFGKDIALWGNIDIEFPLAKGTPEDVEKDIKEHMDVLKPGNGYICSSSHSIVNYIPYENFIAFINSVHEYGKY